MKKKRPRTSNTNTNTDKHTRTSNQSTVLVTKPLHKYTQNPSFLPRTEKSCGEQQKETISCLERCAHGLAVQPERPSQETGVVHRVEHHHLTKQDTPEHSTAQAQQRRSTRQGQRTARIWHTAPTQHHSTTAPQHRSTRHGQGTARDGKGGERGGREKTGCDHEHACYTGQG